MIWISIKSKKNKESFCGSFFYSYICAMEMDFTKYSVEELRELQNKIGNYLHDMNDGFIYVCEVRSYGNRWKNVLTNELAVNNLCVKYDGYDGIVDVYTTNPEANIQNYGEVNYIKSEKDYDKWKQSNVLMDLIKSTENEIDRFNKGERPFKPFYTEEDILGWRNELELLEWTYEEPISINKNEDYDE